MEIHMTDERIFIARKVATDLFAVEDALDHALAEAARFVGSLSEARAKAKLSAVVGQDVFGSATAAITALTEARRNIVEMHHHLDDVKTSIGMRTVMFGCGEPKPSITRSRDVALSRAVA